MLGKWTSLVSFVLVVGLTTSLPADTNWTGAVSNDWYNAANWTGIVPNESERNVNNINRFIVYPGKLVSNIPKAKIEKYAQEIFQKGLSLQELHWLLAEKNALYDQIHS